MTNIDYLKHIEEFHEKLRNDPEKLKVFLRSIMGRPHKTLEGKEKDNVMLLLSLATPYKETNNQHSWTDYYNIGGKEYHATYFPDDKNSPIIDEMLSEEE